MKVLVTGAGGLVGRHTVDALQARGMSVLRVLRASGKDPAVESYASAVGEGDFRADLRMSGTLDAVLRSDVGGSPCAVVHLAAAVPASFEEKDDAAAASVNEEMDRQVFASCLRGRLPIIYASTSAIYGPGDGSPLSEDLPLAPTSRYAAAKLASENLGRDMLSRAGIPFVALRLNAPYGSGQRLKTVLHQFLERARQSLPLQFHGSGNREQDFTAAADIAEAIVLALGHGASGVFNISGGQPITMKSLAELVVTIDPSCTSSVVASGLPDPQEGRVARFDTRKAFRELGWSARTPLRVGIERLYQELNEGERASRPPL